MESMDGQRSARELIHEARNLLATVMLDVRALRRRVEGAEGIEAADTIADDLEQLRAVLDALFRSSENGPGDGS